VQLRDVDDVAQLGKVGRDVAARRDVEHVVVLRQGGREAERREERADRRQQAAQLRFARVAPVLLDPPARMGGQGARGVMPSIVLTVASGSQ
jgi:hypothetical protein